MTAGWQQVAQWQLSGGEKLSWLETEILIVSVQSVVYIYQEIPTVCHDSACVNLIESVTLTPGNMYDSQSRCLQFGSVTLPAAMMKDKDLNSNTSWSQ